METMFDRQYSLTTREVVEIRTRTVTSTDPETGETTEDEEEYEYYILYVTLRNKGFGAVALENLDEEQKERYTATLSLKGNKPICSAAIFTPMKALVKITTFRGKPWLTLILPH